MDSENRNPLEILRSRLHVMGQVLTVLCLTWIGVVGLTLLQEVDTDTLGHHRTPAMREKLKQCEGPFAQRFACSEPLLLSGERGGAFEIVLRLSATLILPGTAWTMWRAVLRRADNLCRH